MSEVQHTDGFADSNGEISGKADLQFCGKLKREAFSFDFLIGMLHILACATRHYTDRSSQLLKIYPVNKHSEKQKNNTTLFCNLKSYCTFVLSNNLKTRDYE